MHLGMQALRNDPEKMGTSVGMLRRATNLMLHLARREGSRQVFVKYQHRLLNFTVSHFVSVFRCRFAKENLAHCVILSNLANHDFQMDTRVAVMIAEILFEIQKVSTDSGSQLETLSQENGTSSTPTDSRLLQSLLEDSSTPTTSSPAPFSSPLDIKLERPEEQRPVAHSPALTNGQRKRKLIEMNGTDGPASKDDIALQSLLEPNGGSEDSLLAATETATAHAPTAKSASDVVKERIRNNILSHQHHDERQNSAAKEEHFEPAPKRPKQNGLTNGTSPTPQEMSAPENHTAGASLASSNATTNSSGSMTAVA